MLKAAVFKKCTEKIWEVMKEMSTMEFLNFQVFSLGHVHPGWLDLQNPLSILKATARGQLLIQMYPLSTTHTAGSNEKDLCTLCNQEPGTTIHFLINCRTLAETR